MKEIWRGVIGHEVSYQISSIGRVNSNNRVIKHSKGGESVIVDKILKPGIDSRGYRFVCLYTNGRCKTRNVHQLMAESFLNHSPNGMTGLVVDHINNNKLDNRIENLQLITHRHNLSKDKKGGTSKYIGVCLYKQSNKWHAQIKINGKKKHLGYFTNELDASMAYQKALSKLT